MAANDLLLRLILSAQDQTGEGVRSANANLDTMANTAKKVGAMVAAYLTFEVVIGGLEKFAELGDKYAQIVAQIKSTTTSTEELVTAELKLYDIAQDSGVGLDVLSDFYAKVSDAGKAYNATQADTLKLSETVALSFKASSSGAAEVNSTITQLSQSLGSDTVQWEDFGLLADTNLKLVNLAAKNLGYDGITAMKKAMSDGQVTSKDMAAALVKGFGEIKTAADAMPTSTEASMTKLNNALLVTVGRFNEAIHGTERWAALLDRIAKGMDNPTIGTGFMAEATAVWLAGLDRMTGGTKVSLADIHKQFEDRRNGIVQNGQAVAQSEAQTAEAVRLAQQKQREAFDVTEARLKAGTKILEGEYARRTEAMTAGLNASKAAVEASALNETVQAQRIAEAEKASLLQRLQAIALYGQQRIALINQTLGTQEQIEKLSGKTREAAEAASLEARKAAYSTLATAYAGVVNDLQGQWQREMELFNAGNEGIKNLALAHEQQILELRRAGMTEREKQRSLELERDQVIIKFKTEAAKNEQADEKELMRLYGEATKLIQTVGTTKAAQAQYSVTANGELRTAERSINELYGLQQGTLEKINAQHKENADTLLPSLDQAKGKLADMNTALGELDRQLAQAKALKLEIDPASLAAAQSQIAALVAPETKTIVVQTVAAGGGAASAPAAPAAKGTEPGMTPDYVEPPPEGKRLGGLIRAFANGGKLPGYGGGDRRLIIAEDGEFVVRKEAAGQWGPLLEAINRGTIGRYATGGLVDDPTIMPGFDKKLSEYLNDITSLLAAQGIAETHPGVASSGAQPISEIERRVRELKERIARAPEGLQESMRQKLQTGLVMQQKNLEETLTSQRQYNARPTGTGGFDGSWESSYYLKPINILQNLIDQIGGGKSSQGGAMAIVQSKQPSMADLIRQQLGNAMGSVTAAAATPPANTNPGVVPIRASSSSSLPNAELITINLDYLDKRQSVEVPKSQQDQAMQFFNSLGLDKRSSS